MHNASIRAVRSFALLFATVLPVVSAASAQSAASVALNAVAQASRVAAQPNFGPQTQLTGHIPHWVNSSTQVAGKSVDLSQTLRVSLVLSRAPFVQAAFEKLLDDQQNPGSPMYHQWLTPQQIGDQFGPTTSDLAAVTAWLGSQGLSVDSVAPNHVILEVSGSLAQVGNAFRTSFAYYNLGDTARLSAISEPFVPTALTPVIKGIAGLTEVPLDPQNRRTGPQSGTKTGQLFSAPAGSTVDPEYTNGTTHFIVPADFNLIYDSASVLAGGNTGATIGTTAQHIAIIGRARVPATSISEFATNTGLASGTYNEVVGGTDPGPACTQANYSTCKTAGDEGEAVLDVERVIGTANGATTDLVVSASSNLQDGVYIAAAYNVNTLRDPIMTISFGSCEVRNGQTGVSLWDTLFSTAAAEGISVFVSSGDSGAAGCDGAFSNPPAVASQYADSPNVICVSSYATCVGGTEFNEGTGTYWNTTNATGTKESAISYIPEGGWNEPTTTNTSSGFWPASSGGGPSIYITKPSWQVATGVPADGARDLPDIAFSGAGHDSYYLCQDDALGPYITAGQIPATASCAAAGGGYFFGSYGTSAASPGMAGLMALINTKLGKAQGNFNPLLYKTYAATPSAFHDTTIASSGVTNCTTATPSMCNNSIPGSASLTVGAQVGYALQTGYDLVTGLGSLDVAAFLTATNTVAPTISTTTTVTASPNPVATTQTVTLTATLKPASAGAAAASGTISFYSNGAIIGSAVTISNNIATTTTSFATAGTYSITASYSGDGTYIASTTTTAVSLVVNATPSFTVTAATPAGTYISGTTASNTDAVTVTSNNSFTSAVALTCTTTGITGATCALAPTSVTPAANGTSASTLTIFTPAGTSGTLTVTVTGTSGTLTSAATVNFTVALPTFTLTAAPSTLTIVSGTTGTVNSSTITLTSAAAVGYAGTVSLVCSTSLPTGTITTGSSAACSVTPATVTIAAGGTATATMTVTSSVGNSGTFSATIVGTRTFTGNTTNADPNTVVKVTVNGAGFTLSTPSNLSFTSGATTGNTTTSTVTSMNGFAGPVTFTCSILGSTPAYPPTCAASSVTLTAGSTAATTITITSTTAVTAANHVPANLNFGLRSGAATLASLLFLVAFRRRKAFRALAALSFLAIAFSALSGCSGGGTPPTTKTTKSSAGSYVVTVTGTGTTTGAAVSATGTTTFNLTIN